MAIKQTFRYLIPVGVKKALKYSFYSLQDLWDFVKGVESELPPKRMNFVGSAEFAKVANEFFGYFKELGELKPNDIVLDIGCGIGRMAIPITKYLNAEGEYSGFDIDKRGINWCKENLSLKSPNFHFQHVDLYNKYYNKEGKIMPLEFKFPYPENSFTFAFATSVFTHMLPEDTTHYLKDLYRVLKPGGRALVTFFSIDNKARENIESGYSQCDFRFANDSNSFYSHKNVREAEIGYLDNWILKVVEDCGFILKKTFPGTWSGKNYGLSYQDIFIISK
jgi:SAM-dependent methyltransferase